MSSGEIPETLSGLIKELISSWYLAEFPGKKPRPQGEPPQGAYAAVGRLIGQSAGNVSKIASDVFDKNTQQICPARSCNAWPVVLQIVEVCVSDPEQRVYWTQRLAWHWRASEGGGQQRPPGYIDALRAPDATIVAGLATARQTDRTDLQVPLLHREIDAQNARIDHLREQHRRLRERVRQADVSRQHRAGRHADEQTVLLTLIAYLQQEIRDGRRRLEAAEAALPQLVARQGQALTEQAREHQTQRDAAEAAHRQREQHLAHQVQELLDAQSEHTHRLEQLTTEREAAYRVADDEATQRRQLQQQVAELQAQVKELEKQLATARADGLEAQVLTDTAEIARYNTRFPPSSPTKHAVLAGPDTGRAGASPTHRVGIPAPRQPGTQTPADSAYEGPSQARAVSRAYASAGWSGRLLRGLDRLRSTDRTVSRADRRWAKSVGLDQGWLEERIQAVSQHDEIRHTFAQIHADHCARARESAKQRRQQQRAGAPVTGDVATPTSAPEDQTHDDPPEEGPSANAASGESPRQESENSPTGFPGGSGRSALPADRRPTWPVLAFVAAAITAAITTQLVHDNETKATGGDTAPTSAPPSPTPAVTPLQSTAQVKGGGPERFSRDGRRMANHAGVWSTTDGAPLYELTSSDQARITAVALNADGTLVAVARQIGPAYPFSPVEREITVYDVGTGEKVSGPYRKGADHLEFQGLDNLIWVDKSAATAAVKRSNVRSGATKQIGPGVKGDDAIDAIAVSADEDTLIIGTGHTFTLWTLPTGEQIGKPLSPSEESAFSSTYSSHNSVDLTSDGKQLLFLMSGKLQVWNADTGEHTVSDMPTAVAAAYTGEGHLITVHDNCTVTVNNTAQSAPAVLHLQGESNPLCSLIHATVSPDGAWLATDTFLTGRSTLWNLAARPSTR